MRWFPGQGGYVSFYGRADGLRVGVFDLALGVSASRNLRASSLSPSWSSNSASMRRMNLPSRERPSMASPKAPLPNALLSGLSRL